MAKATQLLAVLARIKPAIYDVIFPHGAVLSRATAIARISYRRATSVRGCYR